MTCRSLVAVLALMSATLPLLSSTTASPPFQTRVRWMLVELNGQRVDPAADVPIYLEFDFATKRYEGFAGCNPIMGSFVLGPGKAFTFIGVATAKVGCPDPARLKQETLLAETMVQIDRMECHPDRLVFFSGHKPVAVFLRSEGDLVGF